MALHGFWSWLTEPINPDAGKAYVEAGGGAAGRQAALLITCPPSATSKGLVAKVDDLNRTWITTGYYTWQEMARQMDAIIAMTRVVSQISIDQGAQYSTDELVAARDDYFSVVKKSQDYVDTWKKAKVDDALIDAPSFKPWLISLLRAANRLMREVDIAACQEPFWLDALASYVGVFDDVIAIAKAIGRAVVEAGRKVIKAVGWMWPIVKWGAIGFGVIAVGLFSYNKLVSIGESGRKPIDWSNSFSRLRNVLPGKKKPAQISGARYRSRSRRRGRR